MRKSQTTATQESNNAEYSASRDLEQSKETTSEETTETETDETVVINRRIYDTSKPVDEKTGTPPLQEEVTETRQRNQQQKQQQKTETTEETKASETEHTQRNDEKTETTETQQARGPNTVQKVLIWIGSFTLTALLCWLGFRLFKRYLNTKKL